MLFPSIYLLREEDGLLDKLCYLTLSLPVRRVSLALFIYIFVCMLHDDQSKFINSFHYLSLDLYINWREGI